MEPTPALLAAALWAGLILILMVVLSARVVLGRRRLRVSMGDGGHDEMTVLSRTFANAAEYAPVGVAAMVLLALVGGSSMEVHLVGGALFAGRIIHPFGLANRRAPNAARIAGMVLTWSALLGAGVLLLFAAATAL